MGQGATNKRKGSNAERHYAKVFREDLGFSFCKTSRQSNRMLDDAGIDLNFLPFNVQIKAGYAKGLNEFKTLKIIRERLPELFPPYDAVHSQIDVLIHKKDTGRGKKKSVYDELVFFWTKDFSVLFPDSDINISDMTVRKGQKRGWTFEEDLTDNPDGMVFTKDGDSLMVITFDKFKELIKTRTWD
tara:strand:+ start:6153 stop:6710 length:558 start_codon:yes stop_codon:yes gene_type:complete